MILGHLDNTQEIEHLYPQLQVVFNWLRVNYRTIHYSDKNRINIDGDRIYANIEEVNLKEPTEQSIELHHRYMDVHVPVDNTETIGWESASTLQNPTIPYDKDRDIAFYYAIPSTYITVRPGCFCIMTPADGHAPIIGKGTLKKICVKIRI